MNNIGITITEVDNGYIVDVVEDREDATCEYQAVFINTADLASWLIDLLEKD